jgi:putative membrane protein
VVYASLQGVQPSRANRDVRGLRVTPVGEELRAHSWESPREVREVMMQWGWGGGNGWGIIGMLLSLFFLAAIVVGVVLVVRALQHGSNHAAGFPATSSATDVQTPATMALQVLDERYARGEIDREEYLTHKQDLSS